MNRMIGKLSDNIDKLNEELGNISGLLDAISINIEMGYSGANQVRAIISVTRNYIQHLNASYTDKFRQCIQGLKDIEQIVNENEQKED